MKARVLALSLTIAALAGSAGLAGLAGCTADKPGRPPLTLPAADQFKTGVCRDSADPILALGKLTYDRAGAKTLPVGDYQFLVEQGEKLIAVRDRAEPAVLERMNAVLAAIGFVRIRTGKTYDPQLMVDLETARAALQAECVGQA
jgi:hypothetical protein